MGIPRSNDIVERLREYTPDATGKSYAWGKAMKDAGDELEARGACIAELRQSLIGGIELVRSNKTTVAQMTAWAEANERLLRNRAPLTKDR